jgi:hypothetical protein
VASSTGLRAWELESSLVVLVSHFDYSNTDTMLTQVAAAQIGLTAIILISIIFVLGFVADPIINLYLDPWSFLSPWSGLSGSEYAYYYEDESSTWYEHFAKGFASMGVLGFLKVFIASPLAYFRIGGGGRGRTTGRDRYEQVSWIIIAVGVGTFLAVCLDPSIMNSTKSLTLKRQSTKVFVSGVVEHLRKLVSASWMSKATTMTTKTYSYDRNACIRSFEISHFSSLTWETLSLMKSALS